MWWKRKIRNKMLIKQNASSVSIFVPVVILLIAILFCTNNYMRAADIVADNFKTSLDAANLATTVVNVEKMVHEGSLSIIGEIQDNTNLSSYETYIVQKRFVTYEKTLQSNIGLTDGFSFQGGTCGWAAGQIVATKNENGVNKKGTLIIDSFIIYDITETNVYAYEVTNVTDYTETPAINKTLAGTVTRDSGGKVVSTTAFTPEGIEVVTPTVYSKVSFPIAPPKIVHFEWVDYSSVKSNPEVAEYINGDKWVSKTSTTSIKYK